MTRATQPTDGVPLDIGGEGILAFFIPRGGITRPLDIEDIMTNTLELAITGMSCGHCVASVERALDTVPNVERAAVSVGRAQLTLAPSAERHTVEAGAIEAIRSAGFSAALQTTRTLDTSVPPTSCCSAPRSAAPVSSR